MNDLDIKAIRDRLGLTQAQLAQAVGVDQGTVSKWENGAPPSGPARILLQKLVSRPPLPTEAAS